MQKIEKNSGPRTTCFLDPKSTSAIEIGGQKGDQTMESPKSCVPLFLSRKIVVRTILARETGGTHDFGSRKIAAASCVPLFLSSRIPAYHYFSRAGFVRTFIFSSFLIEKIQKLTISRQFPGPELQKSSLDFSLWFSVIF